MIIIGWLEEGAEIVKRGRVDLGESNTMRPVLVAKAGLWAYEPHEGDLEKADRYVHGEYEMCAVFVYENPARESDGNAAVAKAKETAKRSLAKIFSGKGVVKS